MNAEQKKKCAKIAQYYGEGSQLFILQEECAELIQAVSKIRRGAPNAYDHFIEEIADVSIMIEQLTSYMDDDDKTTLYKKVNEKINRQLERISEVG